MNSAFHRTSGASRHGEPRASSGAQPPTRVGEYLPQRR